MTDFDITAMDTNVFVIVASQGNDVTWAQETYIVTADSKQAALDIASDAIAEELAEMPA